MSKFKRKVVFNRLPVNLNHGYIITSVGGKIRKFPSKEVNEWKEEIAWKFKGNKDLDGEYKIEINVVMGDKRNRDVDSSVKFILDALNGVVYLDDNQVVEVRLLKSRGNCHSTTISVWKL